MGCDLVHDLLGDLSGKIGRLISRHPIYFVILPLLIACGLSSGLYKIKILKDYEKLYIPKNARSLQERKMVDDLFPMNLSKNFDMMRMSKLGRLGMVIITPRDNETILRKELLQRVEQVDKLIHNITIEHDKRKLNYRHICARSSKVCYQNGIIYMIKNKNFNFERIPYPLQLDSLTYHYIAVPISVGGVQLDEDGFVSYAKAVRLMYFLDDGTATKRKLAEEWESEFLKIVNALRYGEVEVTAFSILSIENEIHRITEHGLPYACVAVPLMIIISVITCMMFDWVRSKPWLGISGFLTSSMAVGSTFGMFAYLNVDFTDVNTAIALIIFVLGMHNSFIFLTEWRSTGSNHSVEKRMGDTYSQAVPMISVSCLTLGIIFVLSCALPYYVIQVFSFYAVTAIIFTYIYGMTFFGGCMALSGYREETKLHPITCLPIKPLCLSEKRNPLFRWFCTGGNAASDYEDNQKEPKNECMVFFQEKLGRLLKYRMTKIVVATAFAAYLIIAGWLITRIKCGLDYSNLFPSNTYSSRFVKLFYKYFTDYSQRLQVIVNTQLEYSEPEVQAKFNELVQRFENATYAGEQALTESWLKYFYIFVNNVTGMFVLYAHNLRKKFEFLDAIKNYFLKLETAVGLSYDIHFNSNASDILYSRFSIQVVHTHDNYNEMQMMQNFRDLADNSDFPVIVHSMWFVIYDIFLGIKSTFFQFFGTTLLAMIATFFVFVPNLACTFCVFLSFVSIQLGVVAYASLWNIKFNAVSVFSQIGCSIVPILFCLQIPYVYHKIEGKRKVKKTLYYAGMPIFQSSISTLIGLFVLSFVPIPIFPIFFKVSFLVILITVFHAYFVVPTLLLFYEDLFPHTKIKRSFHKTSLRNSFRKSSITSTFKSSIKSKKEPDEDMTPMSGFHEEDEDESEESGFEHSSNELSNEVFEFHDRDCSDESV
ncbi:patched domain-containing protein 3-like [Centruroides sculpturatus]|uniref:patched domain-containing protein 3-like n=2 Tax=Centruroides sculpturatus TaxID=218467 RepID=UPI000C6CBB86|nr:patched domain-containing protein 3-like [Centruroides sculpturatus]XP_023234463.1 patched domain-containing protein 3-like [Centruroides sculpturatus]